MVPVKKSVKCTFERIYPDQLDDAAHRFGHQVCKSGLICAPFKSRLEVLRNQQDRLVQFVHQVQCMLIVGLDVKPGNQEQRVLFAAENDLVQAERVCQAPKKGPKENEEDAKQHRMHPVRRQWASLAQHFPCVVS